MNRRKILECWQYPLWFAHRGGGIIAPENTLKGFQQAYDYGFRAAEFDVKLSQDNQSILLHDEDLLRTAGVNGLAQELSLAELTQVDVGLAYPQYQPAYLPSLKTIGNFCVTHDFAANIEIKACAGREKETAEIVARDALEFWQTAKLPPIFSSFSIEVLKTLQQNHPDTLRGLLIEDWSLSVEELLQQLKELDCISLHAAEKDLTAPRINKITSAGFAILTWTVNDMQRAEDLIKWGVTGVITDLINLAPVNKVNK